MYTCYYIYIYISKNESFCGLHSVIVIHDVFRASVKVVGVSLCRTQCNTKVRQFLPQQALSLDEDKLQQVEKADKAGGGRKS